MINQTTAAGSALALRDETALPGPATFPSQAETDEQVLRLWLHGRGANTTRAYVADVGRFRAFVATPLRTVRLADVQSFADSLEHLSDASRARALSAVKSLFGFAHRLGYVQFDVARPLRLPRIRDRLSERILPEEDVLRLIALEPGARNKALLRTLYSTGVRVSELCGLRWSDVSETDDGAAVIAVYGKGERLRHIRLTQGTWDALRALRGDAGPNDALFRSTRGGGPLDARQVRRIVLKAARRAGIDKAVSPHWLRHCHGSHSLDRACPVHVLQATLGHASLATTTRYVHAKPTESSSKYLAV